MTDQIRAEILFHSMNNVYDEIDQIRQVVEDAENRMAEHGLTNECDLLIGGLDDALAALEDFLPGLEVEANGEE